MNSFNPDYFIHAANVLLLLAYSVRDISLAAVVRLGLLADCDPLFRFSANTAVGADGLECPLCGGQSVPIMASFPRASTGQTDAGRGGRAQARLRGICHLGKSCREVLATWLKTSRTNPKECIGGRTTVFAWNSRRLRTVPGHRGC
jgi:hypothetical protein